uniref:ABC transporter ATP-binding protein n=1 Tax=Streptomyces sp. NRRL S-87 TaxID=1463920 RepID=UPI001F15F434
MIRFEQVSVTYDGATAPTLQGLDLTVPEGELVLLVGPSGVGKSTLLGTVSGLVPHFTGGTLRGRVTVAGRDTRTHPPRELADVVGTVGQDPLAHFVTDTVEDELAYGMESLGLAPAVMRRRVEETLDLLGLGDLRDRPIASLSGGQQQRVAIGSVLTPHPAVLVLDEPTSALDPAAAEDVLAVLQRLVHDLGTTVLMAEHRLERVVQYADRVLLVPGPGGTPRLGTPAEVMAVSPVHPPVVSLGRLAGWSPLPLSVRDARRAALPLRTLLTPPTAAPTTGAPAPTPPTGAPVATAKSLHVRRARTEVLRNVDLTLRAGEVTALMGRNGAGKSTLLSTLVGMTAPHSGGVTVAGHAPHRTEPAALLRHVGLVPQEPRDLLYADTVAAECTAADQDAGADPGTCRALVARLLPGVADDTHPRDLSEGQRLALALAIVLTSRPRLLLLDEPTRGLDYAAKARLVEVLRELADRGHAILLATHDVELAAELAHRVVILAGGEVVADGPTAEVVVSSPAYAPQVAKILTLGGAPDAPAAAPWLTVGQVAAALAAHRSSPPDPAAAHPLPPTRCPHPSDAVPPAPATTPLPPQEHPVSPTADRPPTPATTPTATPATA